MINIPASYMGDPRVKSGPRDRLPWLRFSWFSSVPPGEFQDSTLKSGQTASFQILSNSSFTYHPIIRRYIVLLKKCRKINYRHTWEASQLLRDYKAQYPRRMSSYSLKVLNDLLKGWWKKVNLEVILVAEAHGRCAPPLGHAEPTDSYSLSHE
jgi:hypothetical protein